MIEHDCRSITGRNLRKLNMEAIAVQYINNIPYKDVRTEDTWKINFVKELMDIKSGKLNMAILTHEELKVIAEYVCCI